MRPGRYAPGRAAAPFPKASPGETALPCPRPSGSATRNPQSAIRNPYQKSAVRIRNPCRFFSFSRAVTAAGPFYGRAYSQSVKPVLP
jgi:hypothetical protein